MEVVRSCTFCTPARSDESRPDSFFHQSFIPQTRDCQTGGSRGRIVGKPEAIQKRASRRSDVSASASTTCLPRGLLASAGRLHFSKWPVVHPTEPNNSDSSTRAD